jgi:hypothetical protein
MNRVDRSKTFGVLTRKALALGARHARAYWFDFPQGWKFRFRGPWSLEWSHAYSKAIFYRPGKITRLQNRYRQKSGDYKPKATRLGSDFDEFHKA